MIKEFKNITEQLYTRENVDNYLRLIKTTNEYDIYKFISTLDFLNEHMHDKYLIPSSKEMIKSGYNNKNTYKCISSYKKIEYYINKLLF